MAVKIPTNAGLKPLAVRQRLARRISDYEGIPYNSAMRRLQRYVTEAGQKRSVDRSPKLEAVRDVVPFNEIIEEREAKRAAKVAKKSGAKKRAQQKKPVRKKSVKKLPAKKRRRNKAVSIEGIRKLKAYVSKRAGCKVSMTATYDFYSNDKRHRTVKFRLSPREARGLLGAWESGGIPEAGAFLVNTKGAGYMAGCEVYAIDDIHVH